MKITIAYEASWRNSFLDGSNDEPVPERGRKFIGSMTELKKDGNFKKHDVTLNTVMGILNRLIGDQRKLYQSRQSEDYFFRSLESEGKIRFDDRDDLRVETQEMVYIRNVSGSTDQNAFTGLIKENHSTFTHPLSKKFWGVLWLSFEELLDFVMDEKFDVNDEHIPKLNPSTVVNQAMMVQDIKNIQNSDRIQKVIDKIEGLYVDQKYVEKNDLIKPERIYAASLYIQLERLSSLVDSSKLAKVDKSKTFVFGFSKRGFNGFRDFMKNFITGLPKPVWGNPFLHKQRIKGQGEVTSMLTKASGELDIYLDVSVDEAKQIRQMIYDAGVSGFYLGKKGLAYVREISLSQNLNEVAA